MVDTMQLFERFIFLKNIKSKHFKWPLGVDL